MQPAKVSTANVAKSSQQFSLEMTRNTCKMNVSMMSSHGLTSQILLLHIRKDLITEPKEMTCPWTELFLGLHFIVA